MSQLLNGQIAHICNRVFCVVGVVVVAATTSLSQQVETIKTDESVTCDGKEYQVRLVNAATTLGAKKASALAIVLTPGDASESRVFGLYWIDAKTNLPTHRDDTSGTLTKSLVSYGSGQSKTKEPIVNAFFSTLKCSSSDSQVSAIQKVMAAQNLRDSVNSGPITLQNVVQQLSGYGFTVDPAQIQQATTGSIDLFSNLSGETDFANALRRYVSNLLAAEGRSDAVGHKPKPQEVIAMLEGRNKDLEEKIKRMDAERSAFLGAAPGWLVVAFPIMSVLSVAGLVLIGFATTTVIRQWKARKNKSAIVVNLSRLQPQHDQPLSLEQIITSARERRETIEKKYTSLDHNKKGKGRDSSRNRAEEFAQAYYDLESQLEELPKNASPPPSSGATVSPKSASSETMSTLVTNPDITGKLAELVTAVNNMNTAVNDTKYSVEQIGVNVERRFEGSRLLQEIWIRLYDGKGKPYPEQLPDSFNRDVIDALQLYSLLSGSCGRRGDSVAETTNAARQVINDLHSIRENYLARSVDANARLEQIVAGMSRSMKEQLAAEQKLAKYHPNRNLLQAVHDEVSSHEAILRDTDRLLPNQTDSIQDRVSSLVREYRSVKPKADRAEELEVRSNNLQTELDTANSELQAGKSLVDEITLELNFKTDSLNQQHTGRINATLNRLRDERNSSPYLQLRMGLSSALIAIEKASSTNGTAEHAELLDALFLNKVKNGLRELLGRIEECSGEQLWTDVLYEGFNQQWLHYLLRADLLLRTYYSSRGEFSLLRKAISLAATSILVALHDFQVEIVEVGLFEKLPTNMETEAVFPALRNLSAVTEKVALMVQNIRAGDVVVDVTSFPVFVKGVQENRGRAAIANPSAWLQH